MLYTEQQPQTALGNHLECIWFVSGDDELPSLIAPEKVLPDGCIEWIFHLAQPFQRELPNGQWEVQPRSFIVGAMTRFLVLQPTGRVKTMGVRFRPGGAYRFLPVSVSDLTDDVVPTSDVWGREGRLLEDAIFSAHSDGERKRLVEDFLVRRLPVVGPRLRLEAAIAEVLRSHGHIRVDRLATKMNLSQRHLEREFRSGAGLSPKTFGRIIRFQNLLRLVGEDTLREWANLALAGGYADQPHMVREFREFTGQTPTEKQLIALGDLARNFVSPQRLAILLGGQR
ncbi:MAG: AraC family transcriptional regulator [Pyrinomonadaceae bacterium]